MSNFTVAIAACISLHSYAWVICCVWVCVCYIIAMFVCPLLCLRLRLLCLYLICVSYGQSTVCVPGLSALCTFFVPCLLYLRLRLLSCTCVDRPLLCLYLHLLCLCLVPVFCGSSIVRVPGSSAPSTFSVLCPLHLRLCLLRLYLCLRLFLVVLALLVFLHYFYVESLNQGYLHRIRS